MPLSQIEPRRETARILDVTDDVSLEYCVNDVMMKYETCYSLSNVNTTDELHHDICNVPTQDVACRRPTAVYVINTDASNEPT